MKEIQSIINKSIADKKSPVILAITDMKTLKTVWSDLYIAADHVSAGWNLFVVSYHTYFKHPTRSPVLDEWNNADNGRKAELFDAMCEDLKKYGDEIEKLRSVHPMREYLILATREDMVRSVPEILEPEKYKTADDVEPDNVFKNGNLLTQSISKYSQ